MKTKGRINEGIYLNNVGYVEDMFELRAIRKKWNRAKNSEKLQGNILQFPLSFLYRTSTHAIYTLLRDNKRSYENN